MISIKRSRVLISVKRVRVFISVKRVCSNEQESVVKVRLRERNGPN